MDPHWAAASALPDERSANGPTLIAREAELTTLFRALDGAVERGSGLILRGAPGVGKTALLQAVSERARKAGYHVLRTVGTPSEVHLPLAALHRLVRPVLAESAGLRPAQRVVLRGAFGLTDGRSPEIYQVALAVLDLFAEVASRGGLVILADDSHWLDQSSSEVLAFVARRLESDPIFLLAASRDTGDDPLADGRLPELALKELNPAAAEALLDATAPRLTAVTRQRLLEVAGGNPLALLELPKALETEDWRQLPSGLMNLTKRLERAFAERAAELTPASRDLLLLAALSNSSSIAEILRAGTVLCSRPVHVSDLDAATTAGLLAGAQPIVRFRHPLMRSAIYQAAPMSRRLAAHAALASVLTDADRRAWHRAASTVDTDEEVAAELEAAAHRAQARGALPAAVQALERAAALSGFPATRASRLLSAAELAHQVGQIELSTRLLREGARSAFTGEQHRRSEWVRELLDDAMTGGVPRVEALIELADQARRAQERDLAAQFVLRAATRCWHINLGREIEHRVLAAADQLELDDHDPRRIVMLAYAAPLQRGAEVIQLLSQRSPRTDDDPNDLLLLGHAGACAGAFREAEVFLQAAADGLREQGRLAPLCQALSLLAWAALRRSRWSIAVPAADECVRLSRETRQSIPEVAGLAAQAMVAAIRGDVAIVRSLTGQAENLAGDTRNTIGLAIIQMARAIAAAGAERPVEAYEALERIYRPTDVAHQRMQAYWAIGSFAEVAVRSGHRREVVTELAKLTRLVADVPSAGIDVALRLAHAVLAESGNAEDQFRIALDGDLTDWPFEYGRILLAYGGWLRRKRRVTESRAQLRAAREMFDRIGASPWSARARRELRAAGELSDEPAPNTWDALSPQEMHIAQLVAQGLGNKEIGERLYLSHRTVGSHLYKIFPKLGITSRTQLAAVVLGAEAG